MIIKYNPKDYSMEADHSDMDSFSVSDSGSVTIYFKNSPAVAVDMNSKQVANFRLVMYMYDIPEV